MYDSLPPEFAIPAAILAAALYLRLEFRATRSSEAARSTDRPGR